jgi:L-2-hydroxyglutarate oxidase LhgO
LSEVIDIAIIGGGVVGCWLALELAGKAESVVVFERNPGVTRGENQSSRNSGVLHAGLNYDRRTRPLKAKLCVEGNALWYEFCEQHGLPCVRTGKLIVATDRSQEEVLGRYEKLARENRVPDVHMISGAAVRDLEPNVRAHSALLVPTTGIIDPTRAVYQTHVLASNAGVLFMTETEVLRLEQVPSGVRLHIRYRDGNEDEVLAHQVINSAGVHAVALARTLDPDLPLRSAAVRGDAMKFYRTRRPGLFVKGMNVYPPPTVVQTPTGPQLTVGVHLTPTFDLDDQQRYVIGNTVTVGPKLTAVQHLEDYATPVPPPDIFVADVKPFFPDLTAEDLEFHQSGIQARLVDHHDFFIARDRVCANAIHLLGIDSPGLTSAPAIARYVAAMLNADR